MTTGRLIDMDATLDLGRKKGYGRSIVMRVNLAAVGAEASDSVSPTTSNVMQENLGVIGVESLPEATETPSGPES